MKKIFLYILFLFVFVFVTQNAFSDDPPPPDPPPRPTGGVRWNGSGSTAPNTVSTWWFRDNDWTGSIHDFTRWYMYFVPAQHHNFPPMTIPGNRLQQWLLEEASDPHPGQEGHFWSRYEILPGSKRPQRAYRDIVPVIRITADDVRHHPDRFTSDDVGRVIIGAEDFEGTPREVLPGMLPVQVPQTNIEALLESAARLSMFDIQDIARAGYITDIQTVTSDGRRHDPTMEASIRYAYFAMEDFLTRQIIPRMLFNFADNFFFPSWLIENLFNNYLAFSLEMYEFDGGAEQALRWLFRPDTVMIGDRQQITEITTLDEARRRFERDLHNRFSGIDYWTLFLTSNTYNKLINDNEAFWEDLFHDLWISRPNDIEHFLQSGEVLDYEAIMNQSYRTVMTRIIDYIMPYIFGANNLSFFTELSAAIDFMARNGPIFREEWETSNRNPGFSWGMYRRMIQRDGYDPSYHMNPFCPGPLVINTDDKVAPTKGNVPPDFKVPSTINDHYGEASMIQPLMDFLNMITTNGNDPNRLAYLAQHGYERTDVLHFLMNDRSFMEANDVLTNTGGTSPLQNISQCFGPQKITIPTSRLTGVEIHMSLQPPEYDSEGHLIRGSMQPQVPYVLDDLSHWAVPRRPYQRGFSPLVGDAQQHLYLETASFTDAPHTPPNDIRDGTASSWDWGSRAHERVAQRTIRQQNVAEVSVLTDATSYARRHWEPYNNPNADHHDWTEDLRDVATRAFGDFITALPERVSDHEAWSRPDIRGQALLGAYFRQAMNPRLAFRTFIDMITEQTQQSVFAHMEQVGFSIGLMVATRQAAASILEEILQTQQQRNRFIVNVMREQMHHRNEMWWSDNDILSPEEARMMMGNNRILLNYLQAVLANRIIHNFNTWNANLNDWFRDFVGDLQVWDVWIASNDPDAVRLRANVPPNVYRVWRNPEMFERPYIEQLGIESMFTSIYQYSVAYRMTLLRQMFIAQNLDASTPEAASALQSLAAGKDAAFGPDVYMDIPDAIWRMSDASLAAREQDIVDLANRMIQAGRTTPDPNIVPADRDPNFSVAEENRPVLQNGDLSISIPNKDGSNTVINLDQTTPGSLADKMHLNETPENVLIEQSGLSNQGLRGTSAEHSAAQARANNTSTLDLDDAPGGNAVFNTSGEAASGGGNRFQIRNLIDRFMRDNGAPPNASIRVNNADANSTANQSGFARGSGRGSNAIIENPDMAPGTVRGTPMITSNGPHPPTGDVRGAQMSRITSNIEGRDIVNSPLLDDDDVGAIEMQDLDVLGQSQARGMLRRGILSEAAERAIGEAVAGMFAVVTVALIIYSIYDLYQMVNNTWDMVNTPLPYSCTPTLAEALLFAALGTGTQNYIVKGTKPGVPDSVFWTKDITTQAKNGRRTAWATLFRGTKSTSDSTDTYTTDTLMFKNKIMNASVFCNSNIIWDICTRDQYLHDDPDDSTMIARGGYWSSILHGTANMANMTNSWKSSRRQRGGWDGSNYTQATHNIKSLGEFGEGQPSDNWPYTDQNYKTLDKIREWYNHYVWPAKCWQKKGNNDWKPTDEFQKALTAVAGCWGLFIQEQCNFNNDPGYVDIVFSNFYGDLEKQMMFSHSDTISSSPYEVSREDALDGLTTDMLLSNTPFDGEAYEPSLPVQAYAATAALNPEQGAITENYPKVYIAEYADMWEPDITTHGYSSNSAWCDHRSSNPLVKLDDKDEWDDINKSWVSYYPCVFQRVLDGPVSHKERIYIQKTKKPKMKNVDENYTRFEKPYGALERFLHDDTYPVDSVMWYDMTPILNESPQSHNWRRLGELLRCVMTRNNFDDGSAGYSDWAHRQPSASTMLGIPRIEDTWQSTKTLHTPKYMLTYATPLGTIRTMYVKPSIQDSLLEFVANPAFRMKLKLGKQDFAMIRKITPDSATIPTQDWSVRFKKLRRGVGYVGDTIINQNFTFPLADTSIVSWREALVLEYSMPTLPKCDFTLSPTMHQHVILDSADCNGNQFIMTELSDSVRYKYANYQDQCLLTIPLGAFHHYGVIDPQIAKVTDIDAELTASSREAYGLVTPTGGIAPEETNEMINGVTYFNTRKQYGQRNRVAGGIRFKKGEIEDEFFDIYPLQSNYLMTISGKYSCIDTAGNTINDIPFELTFYPSNMIGYDTNTDGWSGMTCVSPFANEEMSLDALRPNPLTVADIEQMVAEHMATRKKRNINLNFNKDEKVNGN